MPKHKKRKASPDEIEGALDLLLRAGDRVRQLTMTEGKGIARIVRNIDEAVTLLETLEEGDPDVRQALINLVKEGTVVVAVCNDGGLCFRAISTIQ